MIPSSFFSGTKFLFLTTFLLLLCFGVLNTEQADTLTLGKAIFKDLQKDQYNYFELPVLSTPISGTSKLVFTVTSISGDADFYLSVTNPTPTRDNCDMNSTTLGEDRIEINSTSTGKMLTGPYYIGVLAYGSDVYYSIIAYTTETHIELQDGLPQITHTSYRAYTYFSYGAKGPFTISSTSIYGDPDIYVSNMTEYPTSSNYTQKQTSVGSDLMLVQPSATPTTYYIGVYGFGGPAYYNIEITKNDSIALLSAGVPLYERIPSHSYQYFKFRLTLNANMTIKVQKKSFAGDPSVYVSTTNERPNATSYQWKSESAFRSEELKIESSSPGYTSNGTYYIGVYDDSFFSADISIVVELSGKSQIIVSGEPSTGTVLHGKPAFFKYFYELRRGEHAKYLEVTATSTDGTTLQLYASNQVEFPTRQQAQYIGQEIMASTVIHINEPATGWLYMSLHSNVDTNYTISVAQNRQFTNLDPGVPASYSIVGGQYRDFVFHTDVDNTDDIMFSLHCFNGDADIYVNTNANVSRENYTWASTKISSDVITVSKYDPARRSPQFSGQFFIAVYGFVSSYFSIVAYYGNNTIEVFDGMPVTGSIQYNTYAYYKYYLTNPGSLSFNLRALHGASDPDLYVSMETMYPTKDNYQWRSWQLGDDYLNIAYAQKGWYYIGVFGFSANTTYLLSVSSDIEALSSFGYSLVDYVLKGQYRYYYSYIYADQVNPVVTGVTLVAGDTTLYINNNSNLPNSTNYAYKDASWPGNFISVLPSNNTFGRWTFAVYGNENSYYYIHSAAGGYQGALQRSQPKIGVVKKGQSAIFRTVYFSGQSSPYSIYVNQISSIPSHIGVYVDQFPNRFPNATNYKWKAEGDDDLLVPITNATGTSFYVAVFAYDADIRFQISFDSANASIYLTEEQPNKVQTSVGMNHYFTVPAVPVLPGQTTSKLEVTIASCADVPPPVLYGSITNPKPNKDNKDFLSNADGKFRQKMVSPEESITNQLYYVGTEASTSNFTFSIYGTTTGNSRPVINGSMELGDLVSTTQQRIKIPRAKGSEPIKYFLYKRVLQAHEDANNINMQTVCAIQNGVAQLVTEIVSPANAETMYYDLDVSSNERYIINVIAVDSYGLSTSYNQLPFNINSTNAMTLGKPLRSVVNATSYARLKLLNVTILQNGFLSVAVTPFSGDVDLYMDLQENFDKSSARWKGESGGFDIIKISRSEVSATTADFYVAVYGASVGQSYFSVLGYTNTVTQELLDGQPQVGQVAFGSYTYFKFYLDDNSTFAITLTPINGDPDLIASTSHDQPTRDNADWRSAGTSIDFIVVNNTDTKFREGAEYFIGVYGWTDARFEITVAKENSIELVTEGVPHGGRAKNFQYDYFKFILSSPRGVFITVTSLTDGADPDIYVSTIHEKPSISRYQWKRDATGGVDTIYIPTTDRNWKVGDYYIAIRAWRIDSVFQLVVRSEDSSMLLTDGLFQSFESIVGSYTTFKFFYSYQRNSLSFTVRPDVEGSVALYGARSTTNPTREKHDWAGQNDGAYLYINIPSGSPVGWYYASVYGLSSGNYTISAATNQRPIVLEEGRLDIYNYVESGAYDYFTYDFDPSLHLDITISTLAEFGDPDLFVATYPRPTSNHYQWKKGDVSGDSLIIKASEIPSNATRLYIGVYGYVASRFSIVVFSTNETIELQDATPIPGVVAKNQYKQYQYELTNPGRVKFSLNVLSPWPADANIYVATWPNPNEAHTEWVGDSFGSDVVDIPNAHAGMYYIAVHAPGYGAESTDYTLQANTMYETIPVSYYVRDSADKDKPRHYKTNIGTEADHVLTSLTLINGLTELYINTNGTDPTRESHMFSSKGFPGNVIYVHKTDPKFAAGTWSVTVYPSDDSDYFVSVQTREGALYNGIPRVGYVEPGTTHRETIVYSYNIGWATTKLVVNVRPFGHSCLVVYGSQKNNTPSEKEHTWKAESQTHLDGQIMLTIDKDLQQGKILYLSVQSCSGSAVKYEISVINNAETVYLTQNYASLFTQTNSEYSLLTTKHTEVLYIQVDSCDNNSMETLRLTASKTKNSSQPEYVGEVINPFSALINSKAIEHKKAEIVYARLTQTDKTAPAYFSIFTTTKEKDPRPVSGTITASSPGIVTHGKVKRVLFDLQLKGMNKNEIAHVFMLQVDKKEFDKKSPDALLTKYNMYTPCGIRMNQSAIYVANTTGAEGTARIEADLDAVYIVNAIVRDPNSHLEQTYKPIVINRGQVVVPGLKFSVGALFILFALIAIVLYVVIGVSYNLITGKESGVEAIPHYAFWSEIPSIILDGIKFIVYCGRGSRYSVFEDEGGYGDDVEAEPNPFTISNVSAQPAATTSTSGGYGAI